MILVICYVASYALAYRVHYGRDGLGLAVTTGGFDFTSRSRDTSLWRRAYRPVEWLIDHTVLSEPLLVWADLLSVRKAQEMDRTIREYNTRLPRPLGAE
jgi:hypothetical protein